jgi:hypothetical protein
MWMMKLVWLLTALSGPSRGFNLFRIGGHESSLDGRQRKGADLVKQSQPFLEM